MILIHFSIMIDWLERKSYENDAILVCSCKLHNIIQKCKSNYKQDWPGWLLPLMDVDQYESIIHDHETSIIIDWSNYLYL